MRSSVLYWLRLLCMFVRQAVPCCRLLAQARGLGLCAGAMRGACCPPALMTASAMCARAHGQPAPSTQVRCGSMTLITKHQAWCKDCTRLL